MNGWFLLVLPASQSVYLDTKCAKMLITVFFFVFVSDSTSSLRVSIFVCFLSPAMVLLYLIHYSSKLD